MRPPRRSGARRLGLILSLAPAFACVQPPPPDAGCDVGSGEGDGLLYPLETGAWWRFEVEADDDGHWTSEKIIEIEREGPVPGRPGASGFAAHSLREQGYGRRWQGVSEDGGIVRYVDQWFEDDGTANVTTHYCPSKLRTFDPEGAASQSLVETYWEASARPVDDQFEQPELCTSIAIDGDTCEPTGPVPAGCEFIREQKTKYWHTTGIEEVTVPARPDPYEAVIIESSSDETFPAPKVYYWARGVGKVREEDPGKETEQLLECCLPSAGCAADPPAVPE